MWKKLLKKFKDFIRQFVEYELSDSDIEKISLRVLAHIDDQNEVHKARHVVTKLGERAEILQMTPHPTRPEHFKITLVKILDNGLLSPDNWRKNLTVKIPSSLTEEEKEKLLTSIKTLG